MLDFVPNHMAPDHDWIDAHPDCFVHGSEADLVRSPRNYCRVRTSNGPLIFAHGRDPYFDGWPDTLQLDYGNAELQQAMIGELKRIAGQCDGLRCDMAMLVLPDVFERTWGIRAEPFWPKATAAAAGLTGRRVEPGRNRAGVGGQLDLGLFHRVDLATRRRRTVARGGQLRGQPESVLCPSPICRCDRQHGAADGHDGAGKF
ncbi:hypothetical protein SB772_28320 [Paraburkholderia sp. SIMBA_030]